MRYIPSREASRILGMHPQTLRKWAREGRIDYILTEGCQRRYDVDSYIRNSGPAQTVCHCRVSSKKQSAALDRTELIETLLERNGAGRELEILNERDLSPTEEIQSCSEVLRDRGPRNVSYFPRSCGGTSSLDSAGCVCAAGADERQRILGLTTSSLSPEAVVTMSPIFRRYVSPAMRESAQVETESSANGIGGCCRS